MSQSAQCGKTFTVRLFILSNSFCGKTDFNGSQRVQASSDDSDVHRVATLLWAKWGDVWKNSSLTNISKSNPLTVSCPIEFEST